MKFLESVGRIAVIVIVALVFTLPFAGANDDGGKGGSKGGSKGGAATASSSSTASAAGGSASAGSGSVSQDNKSYGVGGTGLTSTANCLGSTSILFGLVASTYVEQGCITRLYASQCKDDKCRQRMTCLDPDLSRDAKTALGCKE